MSSSNPPVITEMRGKHTLIAKINRPQAHNAINFEVMAGLEKVCDEIEQNQDIRVFILTGEGHKYFASGGDLKEFSGLKSEQEARKMSMRMGDILRRIESADCWTIAYINGDAYGGGCEVMLAFDFRISVKHARFGFTQGRFYLTPGWGGLTRLIERVSRSTALLWLGTRALVDTESALIAGLIDMADSSSQLENHILDIADKLSRNDRRIIKVTKEGATYAQKYPHRESINNERTEFAKLWASEEHHKRVEAFLKRKKQGDL
ncbi:MAG: enoyl-CoA hydratase/isomerase family protein [Candidatus Cyclonatronum sp.]|uniref:enoyl-CoA hydratase/isomerase family protein n=1 Tax=Cyclonatronum sp. TaxID=3024185 RepID=UPI0025C6365E|nr:enoyl-CoA hydratase/isomerase family protein [Cyclonatronum sp.]MCC5935080.1 enoyl-CoA hydratase/isomerase family protein [Balneolales bacterium]MCH8487055.1 enoyl-CoA hydratase/isomerase family protein [Cyclonatronum sp.]